MTLKDILTIGFDPEDQTNLQQVRLTQSMTPIIIFMREVAQVFLHYLEDLEIRSYIHCNGNGCVCRAASRRLSPRNFYCQSTCSPKEELGFFRSALLNAPILSCLS